MWRQNHNRTTMSERSLATTRHAQLDEATRRYLRGDRALGSVAACTKAEARRLRDVGLLRVRAAAALTYQASPDHARVTFRVRDTGTAADWRNGFCDDVVPLSADRLVDVMRLAAVAVPEVGAFTTIEEFAGHLPSLFWACVLQCSATTAAGRDSAIEARLFDLRDRAAEPPALPPL